MEKRKFRIGFTLIELLIVIVVLGIVGVIALEALRQYYEGIYKTQTYSQRIAEADQILDKLTKYFENAIDMSIVNLDARAVGSADGALGGDNNCSEPGLEANEATAFDYTVAFLGVDVDSIRTNGSPGWSEQAITTLVSSTSRVFTFSDANISKANATITALYPGSDLPNSAFYNHGRSSASSIVGSCTNFNWDNSGNLDGYSIINDVNYTTNSVTVAESFQNSDLKDRKYLIRSGYAFRVLDDGTFRMYTDFRPWKGEKYTTGQSSVLGQNVASFYADFNNTNSFNDRGSIWRLKVCMQGLESNLSTSDIASSAICRERRVRVRY